MASSDSPQLPSGEISVYSRPEGTGGLGPLIYGAPCFEGQMNSTCLQSNSDVTADSETSQCVVTPDLEEAADMLADTGRLVLCGLPGTGKTILGHALLRQWRKKGFTPHIFTSVDDWSTHIKAGRKSFVLMDGTLGKLHADRQQHDRWTSVLGSVLELTGPRGCCKLVITLYPHVLRELQCLESEARSPLRDRNAVLQLAERALDAPTKEKLLRFHIRATLSLGRSETRELIGRILRKDASGAAFMWCCRHLVEHWQTSPDPTAIFTCPAEAYVPLFARWLNSMEKGSQAMAAVLALAMLGVGDFFHNAARAKAELQRLNLDDVSVDRLAEVAYFLKDSILSSTGGGFACRALYDAAGLAFGRSFRFSRMVEACDATFLVQHVRTSHTQPGLADEAAARLEVSVGSIASDTIAIDDNGYRCLLKKLCDEVVDGRQLVRIAQHPTLRCPHFLAELGKYCQRNRTFARQLVRVVDPQHGLPLLYWSAFHSSTSLTAWCLERMAEESRDQSVLPRALLACAFFHSSVGPPDPGAESLGFCSLVPRSLRGFADTLSVCLPSWEDCLTEDTRRLRDRLSAFGSSRQPRWCYLGDPALPVPATLFSARVSGDKASVRVKEQRLWYLVLRILADRKADEADPDGNSALHVAADVGNADAIALLVRSGASLTTRNKQGLTPYDLAQLRRRRLKQKSAAKGGSGRDPYAAIRRGDEVAVKTQLCHGFGVDDIDEDGNTGLRVACQCGRENVADILLDLGANVSVLPPWAATPMTVLHSACLAGRTRTVQLLIDRRANVGATTRDGSTALHFACQCPDSTARAGVTRLLLSSGAGAAVADEAGATPLHVASRHGHADTAELLARDHGADVSARTEDGDTPLHLTCQRGGTDTTADALLRHGAQAGATNKDGDTPLHYACRHGLASTVELLVSRGVDVNVPNRFGRTPLLDTLLQGHKDVAALLTRQGADINARKKGGPTALSIVYQSKTPRHIGLLLEAGAETRPLHRAVVLGDADAAATLILQGADVNLHDASIGCSPLHVACLVDDAPRAKPPSSAVSETDAPAKRDDSGSARPRRACFAGIGKGSAPASPSSRTEAGCGRMVRFLIGHGANANAADDSGATPLHVACEAGDREAALLLLQHEANVNAKDQRRNTPLHAACKNGHAPTALCLLERGADVNAKGELDSTPLHAASAGGHAETAVCLLRHEAEVSAKGGVFNDTPLHAACEFRRTDIAERLLRSKAEVNATDDYGTTPLHKACKAGDAELASRLIQHQADVNAKDRFNNTPLHVACKESHGEAALCLIRHKADVNAKGSYESTPLHLACWAGDVGTVLRLLQRDADAKAENSFGNTPLHIASTAGHTEAARCLLQRKANVNAKNLYSNTPLHKASEEGRTETALCLIRHKANVNAKNDDNSTPLHKACTAGHTETALCLLRRGASVKAKDDAGKTPLQRACDAGHVDTATCLIRQNADTNAKSIFNDTPLEAARLRDKPEHEGDPSRPLTR